MVLAMAMLLFGGETAIGLIAHAAPKSVRAPLMLGLGVLLAAAILFSYVAIVRRLERRRVAELDRPQAPRDLALGLAAGASLFAGVYVILFGLGALHFGSGLDFSHLMTVTAISLTAAVAEETLFRGVIFQLIEEKLGTAAAAGVTAAVFGAMHLLNPGATLWSALAVTLEAGILLGIVFAATRSLWAVIGFHFGWNMTEGAVFGAAVSGEAGHGILQTSLTGPALVTGGAFGPEQSLIAVVLSLIVSGPLLAWSMRNGRFTWTRQAVTR
jgi:membrane protease YdiL (CAAX protease family)